MHEFHLYSESVFLPRYSILTGAVRSSLDEMDTAEALFVRLSMMRMECSAKIYSFGEAVVELEK